MSVDIFAAFGKWDPNFSVGPDVFHKICRRGKAAFKKTRPELADICAWAIEDQFLMLHVATLADRHAFAGFLRELVDEPSYVQWHHDSLKRNIREAFPGTTLEETIERCLVARRRTLLELAEFLETDKMEWLPEWQKERERFSMVSSTGSNIREELPPGACPKCGSMDCGRHKRKLAQKKVTTVPASSSFALESSKLAIAGTSDDWVSEQESGEEEVTASARSGKWFIGILILALLLVSVLYRLMK